MPHQRRAVACGGRSDVRRRLHSLLRTYVSCLSRSLSSCGLRCPYCNQDLSEFAASSSFHAASVFHECIGGRQCSTIQSWPQFDDVASWVPSRSSDCVFLLLPSPWTSTLVCSLVRSQDGVVTCPRPKFRCVGTSVDLCAVFQIHQFLQGVLSTHVLSVPRLSIWWLIAPSMPGGCGVSSARRQDFPPQSVTMESTPDPNWFTHGPLASLGSLYGSGSPPVTQPGTGSQSWLFCPLISLGLLAADHPWCSSVQHRIRSRCAA